MEPVDIFLQDLVKNNFYQPPLIWQHKDKKILESFGHQLKNGIFLTENQANLLIKILNEYRTDLEIASGTLLNFLDSPTWSKEFRLLDVTKNIHISDLNFSEIVIEFSYNKKIKDKLFSLTKAFDGEIQSHKNCIFTVALTEKNICTLIDNFLEYRFVFDDHILNFHKEIVKIKTEKELLIDFTHLSNNRIIDKLEKDIGADNVNNSLLLHDRKLRFQYNFKDTLDNDSLKSKIAKRTDTDIYVDSTVYAFKELLSALTDLQRFPILVIFDPYQPESCKNLLTIIHEAFLDLQLEENIGIYFRMDSINKDFNLQIAALRYNSYLDTSTKLVGLSNKQLPKFIVSTSWKPSALVCFSPSFKNSKIYSYCDSVDLKICYTESKPVTGFDYAVM